MVFSNVTSITSKADWIAREYPDGAGSDDDLPLICCPASTMGVLLEAVLQLVAQLGLPKAYGSWLGYDPWINKSTTDGKPQKVI